METTTGDICDQLLQIAITTYDFQADSGPVLQSRISNYLLQLEKLNEMAKECQAAGEDTLVPLDLVQYIDRAENPDLFTRDFVERAAAENQRMNGRIHAFQDFYTMLAQKINDNMDISSQYSL